MKWFFAKAVIGAGILGGAVYAVPQVPVVPQEKPAPLAEPLVKSFVTAQDKYDACQALNAKLLEPATGENDENYLKLSLTMNGTLCPYTKPRPER